MGGNHRRRINSEEKAKVVASVWGTEFIPFLATQTVFILFLWSKFLTGQKELGRPLISLPVFVTAQRDSLGGQVSAHLTSHDKIRFTFDKGLLW